MSGKATITRGGSVPIATCWPRSRNCKPRPTASVTGWASTPISLTARSTAGVSRSKAVTRVSVDNKALREASLQDPSLLDGLSATYSVPARYEPTEAQKQFITTKPAPAAIKFYEA